MIYVISGKGFVEIYVDTRIRLTVGCVQVCVSRYVKTFGTRSILSVILCVVEYSFHRYKHSELPVSNNWPKCYVQTFLKDVRVETLLIGMGFVMPEAGKESPSCILNILSCMFWCKHTQGYYFG